MISLRFCFVLCSLFILPRSLVTLILFERNPGCELSECEHVGHTAIYYANHSIANRTIHLIYSSLDELTISIFETAQDHRPMFNYSALFAKNYPDAIQFGDAKPSNSFSVVLRRLIQFNDENDTGLMNDNDNTTISYALIDIQTTNITFQDANPTQPTFQLPIPAINGSLLIDIAYPGETMRDSKFPKLRGSEKSFFLNIAFQANNFTSSKTRFAFELYLMSFSNAGARMFSSKYIDDHFTPGIFKVWQLETNGPFYRASMLWKPVVYQSDDRSIEQNTLMEVYSLKQNVTLQKPIDQGIFSALYHTPYVSAFNVSLGQANDGFFTKSNYTFIQFTVGLDELETDSTKQFVTVALITSLALPGVVGLIALIIILKRRFSHQHMSNYDVIRD